MAVLKNCSAGSNPNFWFLMQSKTLLDKEIENFVVYGMHSKGGSKRVLIFFQNS
jgi:hypothetical protein